MTFLLNVKLFHKLCLFWFQVKVEGPGVSQTGCIVNLQTQFTVDTRQAGEGELKVCAQVLIQ